jgi:hypothetical protein
MTKEPVWSSPCTLARYGLCRAGQRLAGGGGMERLQWWLLLLSAVMFSMSGCASFTDWQTWAEHRSHYASSDHLAFSMKNHPTKASISDRDTETATREEWWGRLVPEDVVFAAVPERAQSIDVAGRWRGTWTALGGAFGDVRSSQAEVVFAGGKGHVRLSDVVAAGGVPSAIRLAGSWGVPVRYEVARGQVVARYDNGPGTEMRFTRVGDRLYGRTAATPSLLLVLEKEPSAQ